MYRPRIIPALLLKNDGLVKTEVFKHPNYIGDPINAVKLFNELQADELVFLDIEASKSGKLIDPERIREISEEAEMPFSAGGGIKNTADILQIIQAGAERVVISSAAVENPEFIQEAAKRFGSSSIIVCIDYKHTIFRKQRVYSHSGTKASRYKPLEFAKLMEQCGAGELIIQSIERDGTRNGYDIDLLQQICNEVAIPVVALGGASSYDELGQTWKTTKVNGLAAGSIFVYHGANKGVLISYPSKVQRKCLFEKND